MIRRLAARWPIRLLLTLLAASVFVIAAVTTLQLRDRSRVDFAFSGAMSGRMTHPATLGGHTTSCIIGRVDSTDQWDGNFVGMAGGKMTELTIAITPYQGGGTYVASGFPDAATLKLEVAGLYNSNNSVHVALSNLPPRDYAGPDFGSEPSSASRPASMDQLNQLVGLGRATVKLNGDQKSGSIEATLMNSKAPTAQPVRVRGTFLCGRLDRQS